MVVLCVDGELSLYHLDLLERLTQEEEAAEGWGLAQLRVSEAARRKAADSGDRVSCFSFDELIDLEVDFEPYIEWLQHEVRSRKIDTRYIPLSCKKEEIDPATGEPLDVSKYPWQDGGLDRYVETWLTDPAKKHLSLLGEFGMGKSWFALHFASELAEAWKDAKRRGVPRPRVPLVIPLRDYAKQTSVSALLSEFFFNKHKIGLRSYDVFSILNRMGRLLLIFDGFDEMASRIDRNTMVKNFWELAKAVEPGAKVLLSSRTEHFPEAKEARDLFEARVSASATGVPTDGPTFEIVELVPFDDTQIEIMLSNLLGPDKVESVMSNDDVRDLMRRPVMSELVTDALPEIESGAPVDLTRIYLYAIQRKMDKDISSQRTFTSRADKMLFLSEVSWEMLRTNQLTLNYRDFPDRLRACFGPAVASRKDLDYWEQDMRNQGMFVRNAEGDYGPSHKSLLEFLTAYKYAAELGVLAGDFLALIPQSSDPNAQSHSWWEYFSARNADGSLPPLRAIHAESTDKLIESFGSDDFNPVVYDFLTTMTREHPDFTGVLISHIQSTKDVDDPASLGGNCANLLGHADGTLAGTDLEGVDLTGFRRFDRSKSGRRSFPLWPHRQFVVSQPNMSLIGANLRGAALRSVNLAQIDKMNADFTAADLEKSAFLDSARHPFTANIHPSGHVGALVLHGSGNIETRTILLWPNEDLQSSPKVFDLGSVDANETYGWSPGARYFLGTTSDWWGYSNDTHSFIVSTETGETVDQFDGCASRVIEWGDREALVCDEIGDLAWSVIDLRTHEVLANVPDAQVENATHFSYFDHGSAMRVWAKEAHRTRILHFDADQPFWIEIGELPAGHEDAVSRRPHVTQVMRNNQLFYFADRAGECATFTEDQVSPAMAQLTECEHIVFAHEIDVAVITCRQQVSVWKTGPRAWEAIWDARFSSPIWRAWVSQDNSRLLVTCQSGEIIIHSLLSGETISAISLNPHLAGAKFSTSSNLSDEEIVSVLRAGATVEGR